MDDEVKKRAEQTLTNITGMLTNYQKIEGDAIQAISNASARLMTNPDSAYAVTEVELASKAWGDLKQAHNHAILELFRMAMGVPTETTGG